MRCKKLIHVLSLTVCEWMEEMNRDLQLSGLFALIFMFNRVHNGKQHRGGLF